MWFIIEQQSNLLLRGLILDKKMFALVVTLRMVEKWIIGWHSAVEKLFVIHGLCR